MNYNASFGNFRTCSAVRVNKVTLVCAVGGSLEWLSLYGPTSATTINGQSTTAPGLLVSKPAKDSQAMLWSSSGINETDNLFALTFGNADYVEVHFSFVLQDLTTPVAVTTTAAGTAGQIYRTYLDGPSATALLVPIPPLRSLN